MTESNKDKLKILFVLRSIGHLTYHESTIRSLSERGHRIHLLFSQERSRGFPDASLQTLRAELGNITYEWLLVRRDIWSKLCRVVRELRTCANYLKIKGQAQFYLERWIGYLPKGIQPLIQSSGVRFILATNIINRLFQLFEQAVPADKAIIKWIHGFNPDVVVASPVNHRFSEEVEYVKASKILRVPTCIAVLSWDNLTTKGLFHIMPDLLLAWNRIQEREAIEVHQIPKNRIEITGSPFFDKWFSLPDKALLGREVFLHRMAINSEQSYVIYLGSSSNIAKDETWIIEALSNSLLKSSDKKLQSIMILVRPHGANKEIYKRLSAPNIIVWHWKEVLPDTPEAMAEFAASLKYAVCALGVNTSAMVDAILADCPVITFMVKEYQNTNAAQAIHFRYLLNANIYDRAHTPEESLSLIRMLVENRSAKSKERTQFILDFIRPGGLETAAGTVAAQIIERTANR